MIISIDRIKAKGLSTRFCRSWNLGNIEAVLEGFQDKRSLKPKQMSFLTSNFFAGFSQNNQVKQLRKQ